MCSVISCWFISQFASPKSKTQHERTIGIQILIDAQKRMWKDAKVRVRQDSVATDLTDEEISKIESYLRPENRSSAVSKAIANRDYLIWRMAIEFGMRLGEILAMRVEDCPTRNKPYFSIVRIEERGPDYFDPRTDAPRPKTLSRDLGYQLSDTAFPKLVSNYISEHRYIRVEHKGRKINRFSLSHKFLIIARNGNPLSGKMADKIAQSIKKATGVDFHWHLARHAFFNRAYSAVVDVENPTVKDARVADLVVWGGWEDPESLGIYSRRARRERAKTPLHLWQQGNNEWKALN